MWVSWLQDANDYQTYSTLVDTFDAKIIIFWLSFLGHIKAVNSTVSCKATN